MRFILLVCALVLPALTPAQSAGSVERIHVRGQSLEGNLSGDSAVREVGVYLPPSYTTDPDKRFPVVYMLHGFTGNVKTRFEEGGSWLYLPGVLDRGLARPGVREAIVVMPDAFTRFHGSMYSSSVTTGDWERFIAEDLVAYVDSHYRTLPNRESRGLAGHSMGGYGTLRIGMKRPDVFAALYALSPCCLAPRSQRPEAATRGAAAEAIRSDADVAKAAFGAKAALAASAAWAPNPKSPPFYLELPTQDGELRPDIAAKLAANAPLAFIDQYVGNLRRLEGIAFDSGDEDRGIAETTRVLDRLLLDYGIEHEFEIYPGDHTSGAAERIEKNMTKFFSMHLVFD